MRLNGTEYNTYQWYHVEAQIDCDENYWEWFLDGELKNHYDWEIDSTPEYRENMFTHFFIRRPIFAGVISLVIMLIGGFALLSLPIDRQALRPSSARKTT